MASIIFIVLLSILSGCTTNNTASPTPTPRPTITPTPTPNPADVIIGRWEGSYNEVSYTMQFSADGKLTFNQGGNIANGIWQNKGNRQYRVMILISDSVITLNNNMNQFMWGVNNIVFTKKT